MNEYSVTISEITRRDLFDALRVELVDWSGRLEEPEFLSRVWDLEKLPSFDHRHPDAAGDIWRHRVANPEDWPDDWIYSDKRFDLMHCDDEVLLRFLCEMVHPTVRSNQLEVRQLVQLFNQLLASDGFEIVERSTISGRPIFTPRRRLGGAPASIRHAHLASQEFNAEQMTRQISRLEAAIPHDPELAIGTAKELVESCCKTILEQLGESVSGKPDLPKLTKAVCGVLQLTPQDIPESAKSAKIIKRLLSNLATVTQGLAELRNTYGTGHGRSASEAKGLSPRHAKLAAGAASALAVFLFETYEARHRTLGREARELCDQTDG